MRLVKIEMPFFWMFSDKPYFSAAKMILFPAVFRLAIFSSSGFSSMLYMPRWLKFGGLGSMLVRPGFCFYDLDLDI